MGRLFLQRVNSTKAKRSTYGMRMVRRERLQFFSYAILHSNGFMREMALCGTYIWVGCQLKLYTLFQVGFVRDCFKFLPLMEPQWTRVKIFTLVQGGSTRCPKSKQLQSLKLGLGERKREESGGKFQMAAKVVRDMLM